MKCRQKTFNFKTQAAINKIIKNVNKTFWIKDQNLGEVWISWLTKAAKKSNSPSPPNMGDKFWGD